ncbi:hypothetical protein [Alkalicoccus urumqiensis]|uniref:Uncharacterized protein n=1 Tax=Alkalicoccus urumqiensis TaxID=1548213 RepID=A0A2P6MHR0_ALKUR|nr:hypothetical protein [Alkalicoccus urumqiensis]PRO65793.1 hypothetical protein C6I21_07805 [Alkalicoccus urumqiensis]
MYVLTRGSEGAETLKCTGTNVPKLFTSQPEAQSFARMLNSHSRRDRSWYVREASCTEQFADSTSRNRSEKRKSQHQPVN